MLSCLLDHYGEVKEQFWSRISAGLGFPSREMANRVLSRSRIYTILSRDDTEIQSYFSLFSATFIAPAIVLKADLRNGNVHRGLETNSETEKRLNKRCATITRTR